MNTELVINGLPKRLRLDGWWLSDEITPQPDDTGGDTTDNRKVSRSKPSSSVVLLALLLVVLADWLFWHHEAGFSVALFAIVMSVAMLLARPRPTSRKVWLIVMGLSIMANLPVIEHLQPLSLLFSAFGIVSLAIWLAMKRLVSLGQSIRVFLKITFIGPFRIFTDLWDSIETIHSKQGITRLAVSLVLPLSLGLVFISLLVAANPFLERMVEALGNIEIVSADAMVRLFFWCLVLAFIWPYLNLCLFRVKRWKTTSPSTDASPSESVSLVNASSVRISLILFNGIFAAQTGLDLLVLSGGMALPEGMSYASYAHRGAYPLVATALLAGAFAIGTRKLIIKDRLMRGLVYLWLLQNLFLVLSAAFRLNLYIETYALTYLRVAAFIWMFLVFVGLVLVFLQISRNKGNVWLVTRNSIALFLVLYVSCFVNYAYIIANYNVNHADRPASYDELYICELGPHALPVILRSQSEQTQEFCIARGLPEYASIEGWRDWGFRNWRLERNLTTEFQYQVSNEQFYSSR